MKVRRAIFDKHIFEKETIMALYATKNAFSEVTVFGDYVQKQKKYLFGDFFKEKKPWSEVKDALLGHYLKPYFQKILHTRRAIVYVDCFAGKIPEQGK
mgnify:CR=1 FL=1